MYAGGALGYHWGAAARGFDAESVFALSQKHWTEAPIPPSQRAANPVSAELEATLLRCLAKEPDLRPQSVGELRASLLAGPRALEWGPEARAAWWAAYQVAPSDVKPGRRDSLPLEPTVKIDFAGRRP